MSGTKNQRGFTLTDSQRDVLNAILRRGPMTAGDFATPPTEELLSLKAIGYLRQSGHVFHLTKPAIEALRRAM